MTATPTCAGGGVFALAAAVAVVALRGFPRRLSCGIAGAGSASSFFAFSAAGVADGLANASAAFFVYFFPPTMPALA